MPTAHDFSLRTIDGKPLPMKSFAGKPVLVVNVASFCGLTPQYTDLEKLHEAYGAKGLVVLGVPCNDFGAQEPKSEGEIAKFCETSYGVTFPMTSKEKVIGADAHIGSNNTLVANEYADIPAQFWANFDGQSEPYGLFNRKLARTIGRLGERKSDPSVVGANPCAEIGLAHPHHRSCPRPRDHPVRPGPAPLSAI